jgi:hypothetical protein
MSHRCEGCGGRTTAMGSFCRSCQSDIFQARKRVAKENLLVDMAGGAWWVWTEKGEVLVIGKATRQAALIALTQQGADEPGHAQADEP